MTKRQWVILQQALVDYQDAIRTGKPFTWDDDSDGLEPTADEIDGVAHEVGDLDHDNEYETGEFADDDLEEDDDAD